jgi:uncharacterized protein DUF3617
MRNAIVGSMLALTAMLAASAAPAAAAEMAPGLWRFTQTTTGAGGRARTTRTTRCVRAAEAADPVRYFAPHSRGRCELIENSSAGSRISARLRCTAGETTQEVASLIAFESPTRFTITTTLATSAGGKTASASLRGDGVRSGACR